MNEENEQLREKMTLNNLGAGEPIVSQVRRLESAVTPFFSIEPLPGQHDLMQKQAGYTIKEQIIQAKENLKRWNEGTRLLNVCEVLDLHTHDHPQKWTNLADWSNVNPKLVEAWLAGQGAKPLTEGESFDCTIIYEEIK
jgi:hypothetical protein